VIRFHRPAAALRGALWLIRPGGLRERLRLLEGRCADLAGRLEGAEARLAEAAGHADSRAHEVQKRAHEVNERTREIAALLGLVSDRLNRVEAHAAEAVALTEGRTRETLALLTQVDARLLQADARAAEAVAQATAANYILRSRYLDVDDPTRTAGDLPPLDAWMAEAPAAPPGTPPDRRRALDRAWAALWLGIQPACPPGWTRPVLSPGVEYLRGVWLWDTGFHLLGLLHGGPLARRLADWQLEVLVAGQHPEGKLPREVHRDGPQFLGEFGVQAPGLLTLAANRLHRTARDPGEAEALRARLAAYYPAFVANHEWFFAHADRGRGLCGWRDLDSGWDTSPRWDEGTLEALDLNCWLHLDRLELARMARTLGRPAEAEAWGRRAAELLELIRRHHWNDERGVYNDTLPDGRVGSALTPVIAWPLWTGVATADQARRTAAHLADPATLASPRPLASAAQDHPGYDPAGYWRGPAWVQLNWIAVAGLLRHGLRDQALALREDTLAMVARHRHLHEYYDSQTGAGLGSINQSWTAALYIDLLMDESSGQWAVASGERRETSDEWRVASDE
jgi:Trehalase